MIQLFRMAFRDLGRNRRRTFFSILALAMGLALLITDGVFYQWRDGQCHGYYHPAAERPSAAPSRKLR